MFLMRNFLLVIILFFGWIRFKNLKFLVMNLLDKFLFYSFEIYVMVLDGEINIRVLKVLWCLYELNVWDCVVGFFGIFI